MHAMARSAWLGAGIAAVLALLIVVAAGGAAPRDTAKVPPVPSQAPAPTMDPVIPDSKPATAAPSASPEAAPSQATSSHKEIK